jgi:hypothetical protein
MTNGILAASRQHKHTVLLVLLLASLAIQAAGTRFGAGGLFDDSLRTAVGVSTFLVVFQSPRLRVGMSGVLVVILAIGWGRHLLQGRLDFTLSLAYNTVLALFLWVTVGVILRGLFRSPAVGAEQVLGAICGYLLAGDAWAAVNAFTYLLLPSAYGVNPDLNLFLADWHGRQALFSYYSLTQMLTIGYADVTPVRSPATTLSLFAALFGVFYMAVVVAQFVGLAQSGARQPPNDT